MFASHKESRIENFFSGSAYSKRQSYRNHSGWIQRKVTIVDSMIPFILKFLDINGRNSCTVTNDSIQDIKYIAIDNVVKRVTFWESSGTKVEFL